MFSAIVPDNIAFHCAHLDDVNIGDLHIEERQLSSAFSHDGRKNAFIAGRAAARQAQLKLTGASAPVGRDVERYPIWPDGLVGSITHTENTACAVVAKASDYLTLGIDVETYQENPGIDVSRRIATEDEYLWIHSDPEKKRERTIQVFCAKEALFKAIYPHYEKPFGFQAAELSWLDGESKFQSTILLNGIDPALCSLDVHMVRQENTFGALVYA